jgi:hypothetical protein
MPGYGVFKAAKNGFVKASNLEAKPGTSRNLPKQE